MKSLLRSLSVVVLTVAVLIVTGCGPRDAHVPVSGKITLGGGPWLAKGTVTFACEEAAPGFDMEPKSAEIALDGSYSTSLLPGKYVLNLENWEEPPSMEKLGSGKSYIPSSYQANRFKLEVPVGHKGTLKKDFDVAK